MSDELRDTTLGAVEGTRTHTWHFRCGWCGFIERGSGSEERAGDALERHNAECLPRLRFIHDVGESRLRYVLKEGDRL